MPNNKSNDMLFSSNIRASMGSKPGLRLLHRNMMMSAKNQRNNVFDSGTRFMSYGG